MRTEMGLGRSRRDTHLHDYEDTLEHEFVNLTYKIPDGIPAWIKIRVTDAGTVLKIIYILVLSITQN